MVPDGLFLFLYRDYDLWKVLNILVQIFFHFFQDM